MEKKFFLRNLLLYLIPLLIPVIVLGFLSIYITQENAKKEIIDNSTSVLKQLKDNTEFILSESDTISKNFETNPEIIYNLKSFLRNSINQSNYYILNIISDFLKASAYSKSYIHSIYVYFNNPDKRFLTTSDGLVYFDNFYDKSWYYSFQDKEENIDVWNELRSVKRYSFEEKPIGLYTLYTKLYSPGLTYSDGIIVLNIYKNYIDDQLKSLITNPDQYLIVVDKSGQIMFKSGSADYLKYINLSEILVNTQGFFSYNTHNKYYEITKLYSNKYGWNYISIVPQEVLYRVPNLLSIITLILFALSFILGLTLTFFFTRKNCRQIYSIISIIELAENGNTLPILPNMVKDEYSFIIHNILKTFIEQSNLKVQLTEKRYQQQAMELLALQTQINPHFLYNTLDTLNWIAIRLIGQPNMISNVVGNLSEILKYSLDTKNKIVPLFEEINNTSSYINIQKIRYDNKFDVIWECDERASNYCILKLLLQPLIENCIYHGIKPKKRKSLIKVKIRVLESCLSIGIIDNGLGIECDKLQEIRKKFNEEGEYCDHIGLFNTNKRLKLIYGDNYKINIRSKQYLGTAVYIRIPLLLAEKANKALKIY